MQIEMLLPQQRVIALEELRSLLAGGAAAEPFHASVVDASIDFSQRIFHDPEACGYPELLALAYWMRKAEMNRGRRLELELEWGLGVRVCPGGGFGGVSGSRAGGVGVGAQEFGPVLMFAHRQ